MSDCVESRDVIGDFLDLIGTGHEELRRSPKSFVDTSKATALLLFLERIASVSELCPPW